MDFGKIIQFMLFIIIVLIMAKVFGFADNGFAVLVACGVGGTAFIVINIVAQKLRERKIVNEEKKTTAPIKKNKKKNPNKKKSGTGK